MVRGSCKRDAVWNSCAVLAHQDEVEIFGAGQAVTKVIGSSEEGTVDSVLTRLRLDYTILMFLSPISLFLLQQCLYISMHADQLLCDWMLLAVLLL